MTSVGAVIPDVPRVVDEYSAAGDRHTFSDLKLKEAPIAKTLIQ